MPKLRLKELRNERGLSLAKLEALTGISASSLSQYENDIYEPDLFTLRKLANFFDVSLDYLTFNSAVKRSMDGDTEKVIALFDRIPSTSRAAIVALLQDLNQK